MAKNKTHQKKLSGADKQLMINMIGGFFENQEIVDHFQEEYGIKITGQNVSYYRKHKKPEIREARKKFQESIVYLPVAQKTWRLRVRQYLIDNLLKDENLWCKEYGLEKKGDDITLKLLRKKGNHNHINNILESAQEELEPKRLAFTDITGKKDIVDKFEEALQRGIESAEEAQKRIIAKQNQPKRLPAPVDV